MDMAPARNAAYLDPAYWEERFAQEDSFDWCRSYAHFRPHILPHLRQEDSILVVGCGNSTLTADLFRDGYTNMTSTDLSPCCIERMRKKAKQAGMERIRWQVADMLSLPFLDNSFDVVIEKGTMDVLFVDNSSPWNVKEEVKVRVSQMLAETHRVLTTTGVFVSITFAQPHFRTPLLLQPALTWNVEIATFGTSFHYFMYILRKGAQRAEYASQHYADTETRLRQTERWRKPESALHEHMDHEDFLARMDL